MLCSATGGSGERFLDSLSNRGLRAKPTTVNTPRLCNHFSAASTLTRNRMDSALLNRVIERIDADPGMSAHAEMVLGACEGRDVLETFLTGGTSPARPSTESLG